MIDRSSPSNPGARPLGLGVGFLLVLVFGSLFAGPGFTRNIAGKRKEGRGKRPAFRAFSRPAGRPLWRVFLRRKDLPENRAVVRLRSETTCRTFARFNRTRAAFRTQHGGGFLANFNKCGCRSGLPVGPLPASFKWCLCAVPGRGFPVRERYRFLPWVAPI